MYLKLLIATIITGIVSGLFITLYELLIIFVRYFVFFGDPTKTVSNLPIWYIYALPTIAIFIVNYMVTKDASIREYGVNEIAESIAQNKLVIKVKTLILKIVSSVLSLSTGFMVGTEGPSAGIGAMIAYLVYRVYKFPKVLLKLMISLGATSGIAAIFVSPLTGIAFAVENIAYQFLKQYIGYLILAAVVAFAVSVNYLEPIIFKHSSGKSFDTIYILANIAFIPFITIFIYFYLFLKKYLLHHIDQFIFKKMHSLRPYIFALIGGLTIGTILLLEPHAAFSGKSIVMYLINHQNNIPLIVIFVLIVLRIVGTTVSIYANSVGGLFLPVMSIGALVGYGFGELLKHYGIMVEPFYFAAIGAAVFMGVTMKLPLTAVVLAVETTYDYNVVVATGICVVMVEYISSLVFSIDRKGVTKREKLEENR